MSLKEDFINYVALKSEAMGCVSHRGPKAMVDIGTDDDEYAKRYQLVSKKADILYKSLVAELGKLEEDKEA